MSLHYTAMVALGEEAAITVSSLTTDLRNSWAKNNTEGLRKEPSVTATFSHYPSGSEVNQRPRSERLLIPSDADYPKEPMLLKFMQSCLEEHHSYCINGLCALHSELRKPICRCLTGYNGERCEHLTLSSYAHNSYEHYIAVGIGTGMLLSGIIAIIYCYVRKRCRKLKSPYKV
ncbi:epigen [Emydura macquarii macquarii]|uniref:epigen n=1 Tax=Emydura macquarii macquarii TaxID=1129001 RepID=UPI00352B0161